MKEFDSFSLNDEIEISQRQIGAERESCLTVSEIAVLEKKSWTWVVRRIAPFKKELEVPKDIMKVKEIIVPVQIAERLHDVSYTNIPAEDWITTTAMADELGVDYKWVHRRILYLDSPCEYRFFQTNRTALHFPTEALEELQIMRDQAIEDIDREKYLHLSGLADAVGRHRLWVTNRIDSMDIEVKLGYDDSGKMVEYYSIEVLEQLVLEKERYKDSEKRLSIPMLATEVGKDREWVEKQLEEIEAVGKYRRFEKSGRVDLCFDTDVLEELLERASIYKSSEPGWFTTRMLVEIVGKSRNWIKRRLKQIGAEPKLLEDTQGALREQYSRQVLDGLLRIKEGWKVNGALGSGKEERRKSQVSADQFKKIYELTGSTISRNRLINLGATNKDIEFWIQEGLITRWSDGMYYFTKKAELVIGRMKLAEMRAKELEEMKLWLD